MGNQGLEDKLLRVVDHYEGEKGGLSKDLKHLTNQLLDAQALVNKLTQENDRYRTDCNVAVNLLQCKPSHFVSHKLSTLPGDLQKKVTQKIKKKDKTIGDPKIIKVPIPTFPPTAMVYSLTDKKEEESEEGSVAPDVVSAAIMAKVLQERK